MRMHWIGMALVVAALPLGAQESPGDKVTVKFSDPSRPGKVRVHLLNGSISVKGYDGAEVVVEARSRGSRKGDTPAPPGLRRVEAGSTGLTVEEENNTMEIGAATHARIVDLSVQAPRKTALSLKTLNNGTIAADQVEGEIEISNLNGPITLTSVAGSVVAHSLNGKVVVSLNAVEPSKPMSFSTLNGDIDVTLPASTKANLVLNTSRGEIFSDFDMQIQADTKPVVEDSRSGKGKYKVRFERGVAAKINGGGPDYRFKTFNGTIYIRKGK